MAPGGARAPLSDGAAHGAGTHVGAQHFCDLVEALGEPVERALVAGCGLGHEARYIARRLGAETAGIDIGIEWEPALTDGVPLELQEASVLELPYPDRDFTAVFYHHVIEHVSDGPGSLREIARVMRPGGLLYVGTPNRHRIIGYLGSYDAGLADKLRWNVADYRARLAGRFRNELGAHAGYTERELAQHLRTHFRDVRSVTADYMRKKYGGRLPARVLDVLLVRPVREFASPAVYAIARRR